MQQRHFRGINAAAIAAAAAQERNPRAHPATPMSLTQNKQTTAPAMHHDEYLQSSIIAEFTAICVAAR